MSVYINAISDKERAEIAQYIRIGIGWGTTAPFSCTAHMRVNHGVYFDFCNLFAVSLIRDFEIIEWDFTPRGLAMREWIDRNISGKYAIQSHYVYFEDYDDAFLCYLRYKG